MKKLTALLCLALLCGCSQPESPQADTETPEEPQQTENTEQPEALHVLWVKAPSMKLDLIKEMEAHPYILGASVELIGYPSEWAKNAESSYDYDIPDYRNDALIAAANGKYGIIDYDGNVLYPLTVEKQYPEADSLPISWQPYTGYITWQSADTASLFSADFTSLSDVYTGGLGGWAPTPYVVNHHALIDDPVSGAALDYENPFEARVMAPVQDESGNVSGCAVIDRDSSVVMETDQYCGAFVNGFVRVTENEDWTKPGKSGFVNAQGTDITGGTVYEEAKYFSEGYAPVKTGGKWMYIDETGRQVTDAIFTDASVVNGGRAVVAIGGLYGVLDLAGTLKQGIPVNEETCAGSYQAEEMNVPETVKEEPLGTVTVLVDGLNSRKAPSTEADKLDKAENGASYDVYEIKEAEGYTWYRIGENRWIADNGEWCSYSAE